MQSLAFVRSVLSAGPPHPSGLTTKNTLDKHRLLHMWNTLNLPNSRIFFPDGNFEPDVETSLSIEVLRENNKTDIEHNRDDRFLTFKRHDSSRSQNGTVRCSANVT